jgi:hypothetical protein
VQDFTASPTAGLVLQQWQDPERPPGTLGGTDPGAPSRINPIDGYPHTKRVGVVGTEIELTASVGGVAGPMDAALGGRLFTRWFVETPCVHGFTSPAGQSSVVRFTPWVAGHYCVGVGRVNGGTVLVHFDVGT